MSLSVKAGGIWKAAVSTQVKVAGEWLYASVDAKQDGEWHNSGTGLPFVVGTDQVDPGVFGMQSNFSSGDSYLQMVGSCEPTTFTTPAYIGPIYSNLPYLIHEVSSDNNAGTCSLIIQSLNWPNAPEFDTAAGNAIAFSAIVIQTVTFQTVTLQATDATITNGNGAGSFVHTPKFTWPQYLGWEGSGVRQLGFIW